jgi:putative methyltransferase (TIGR04325 family)
VDKFRNAGAKSEYLALAFEPRILENLEYCQQIYPVGFIGGYSGHHKQGTVLLETVARNIPVSFWGYGIQNLPPDSRIRATYQGEVWGLDMFETLAQTQISLNRHIDIAGRYAANMRLYEATGVGSCLVTDHKDNLHQLFEPGREVVTYTSPEDCIEKVRYLLNHEAERKAIAQAGQARTLREHTYLQRMRELVDIVQHYLPRSTPTPPPQAHPTPSQTTMFWDDIKLVTQQIEKYGLRQPFIDLGGLDRPVIADYDLTLHTGDQNARFVALSQRPFDHIDPDYRVLNPEKGDPFIENLPQQYSNSIGTAVCLSVLEHVDNPFQVFQALYQIMRPNSLLILSTVFSYPYHPSPNDYWRYTPACLKHLSQSAGFQVLECDWRLTLPADKGIRAVQDGTLLEVKSVYATLSKGDFQSHPSSRHYALPQRRSRNPQANQLIAQQAASNQPQPSTTSNQPVVLVLSDVANPSPLGQNCDRILSGLSQSGQTLIHIHPKDQAPANPHPQIQYQELPYNPQQDFTQTFTRQDEIRTQISQLRPHLVIFIDSCPVSNFAAKQIVSKLGIPFFQIVGSALPQIAQNFAPCLPSLGQWYQQSQITISFSQTTLNHLQQHFGLPANKSKLIQGGTPIPDYLPPINMQSSSPQTPTPPSQRPQWEYLPQGWKTQDPHILGWNVQSILQTQQKKWPAFIQSLQGTRPLGINHESPNPSASDYGSHNTLMTYGYVLAKAAHQKQKLSILDWGGGLGHYYPISQALLPDLDIDYTCKDLPLLCQGGRELLPNITFYDDEHQCFQRNYNLVLSSSSLQYSPDWQQAIQKLVQVSDPYLFITRLPIVHHSDSFVVVQRPYAYGYHTEYMTWFLNRQAVIDYTLSLGMEFVREFLIAEKFPVPNAPETAEARGFLFKRA